MYFEILIKLYSVNLESYEKKHFYLVSSIKTDVNSLLFIISHFTENENFDLLYDWELSFRKLAH